MYVCICNAVTDHRIREAIDRGADTFEALQGELEVSTCCGCCEDEVRGLLEQHLAPGPEPTGTDMLAGSRRGGIESARTSGLG